MNEPWTLRKIIGWIQGDLEKRGFGSPRLDADLLVSRALGLTRIALYLDLDRPLMDSELGAVRALVERRRRHEPMAYILGEREFYGHTFEVNADVLIPRPDTETLVERAITLLTQGKVPDGPLLDVCTGSGAIAISLAKGASARPIVATDISQGALDVAARNASRLSVSERVSFLRGDLFSALDSEARFALVAINPPYIATHEIETLMPDVRSFEPRLALDAGEDGLSFYRRIAADVGRVLMPGGVLLLEVGQGQADAVVTLLGDAALTSVAVHNDLGGIARVVEGWRT